MTKRWLFTRIVVAVLWCMPLAIGLEVYARIHGNAQDSAAEANGWQRADQDAAQDEAVWREYATVRPVIGADMADRKAFAAMDEPARNAFAASHRQLILLCGKDGVITSVYPAPLPQALNELTQRIRPGANITDLFSDNAIESSDCQTALGQAFQSGMHVPREYAFSMSDAKPYHAQFMFYPIKDPAGNVQQMAVFIRDSMWKVLWQEFQPNVDQNDFYVFHSNNLGFRGPDITLPKPPGIFRIVCIGGSTTAEGETGEMTYPAMLEKKLRRYLKTDAVEVINGGIYGMNSEGEIRRLPDYIALQPDLIIHYNVVNDIRDRLPGWMAPRIARPLKSLQAMLRKSRFLYDHCNRCLVPSDAELTERIDTEIVGNLRTVMDAAQQAGIGVAVCSFASPDAPHLSAEDRRLFNARINTMNWGRLVNIDNYRRIIGLYNRLVQRVCKEKGAIYVPVAEELRGGSLYFSDICHLFPVGRERKADILFNALKDYIAARLPGQR